MPLNAGTHKSLFKERMEKGKYSWIFKAWKIIDYRLDEKPNAVYDHVTLILAFILEKKRRETSKIDDRCYS